jgi:proteasome lid subunit RPN8/RPN11
MPIELTERDRKRIEQHATKAYPNECCGLLLGREENGRQVIVEVAPIQNAWQSMENNPYEVRPEDSLRNRSLVDPKDWIRIDRKARQKGLDIPTRTIPPARPSLTASTPFPFLFMLFWLLKKELPAR